jgi:hypothetical protein
LDVDAAEEDTVLGADAGDEGAGGADARGGAGVAVEKDAACRCEQHGGGVETKAALERAGDEDLRTVIEVNARSATEREGEQEELRDAHELTGNATESADGREDGDGRNKAAGRRSEVKTAGDEEGRQRLGELGRGDRLVPNEGDPT